MNTQILVSGIPEKAYKFPALKVDNLRHIHDHGLAVVFSDPKLSALMAYLAGRDGKFALTAGKSRLTVTRLGRVTVTEAFWNVGSWHVSAIHYLDAAANLRHKVRADGSDFEALAGRILQSLTLGNGAYPLPRDMAPDCGKDADYLRKFFSSWSWVLLGEAGLRSRALAARESRLKSDVSAAQSRENDARNYLDNARSWLDGEKIAAAFEKARADCASLLDTLAKRGENYVQLVAELSRPETTPERIADIARDARCDIRTSWGENPDTFFPGVPARYSREVVSANYSATVSGEKVTFSSGIVCPFSYSALVAWLRGAGPAPVTQYGAVEKLEVATRRDGGGEPVPAVFLRCGCHRIDAATVNAELAELLRPAHTVTLLPAHAEISLSKDRAGFVARAAEKLTGKIADGEQQRAGHIHNYAQKKAKLEADRASLPAVIAERESNLVAASATLAAAIAARDDAAKTAPLGADADSVNIAASKILHCLFPHSVKGAA